MPELSAAADFEMNSDEDDENSHGVDDFARAQWYARHEDAVDNSSTNPAAAAAPWEAADIAGMEDELLAEAMRPDSAKFQRLRPPLQVYRDHPQEATVTICGLRLDVTDGLSPNGFNWQRIPGEDRQAKLQHLGKAESALSSLTFIPFNKSVLKPRA
jgi:hypothetical protein